MTRRKSVSRQLRLETLEDRRVLSVTDGVVVHYDFNGNAADSSGLGNSGAIIGSPAFVAGPSDQAVYFNNPFGGQIANQYVTLPNSASILGLQTTSFTFALNYKSDNTDLNNGRLFGRNPVLGSQSVGSFLIFDVNSGAPETYFLTRDTSGKLLNTLPVVAGNPVAQTSDSRWHWGVVVLDRAAGEVRQYVDTHLVATVPFSSFNSVTLSDLSIGRIAFNTTFGARQIAVDDFRMWNRALTTQEVNELMSPVDLAAASLAIDNGNVDFSYEIAGAALPAATTVNLYWSDDTTFGAGDSPALAQPITVAAGTAVGTYMERRTTGDLQGTKRDYLILVVDPPADPSDPNDKGTITESNENNNEKAAEALTDIALVDATTTDFRSLTITYKIANVNSDAFILRAYSSADATWDPSVQGGTDLPISQQGVSDISYRNTNDDATPKHTLTFQLAQQSLPRYDARYLIVVADPDGGVRETDKSNNEIFVIPLFPETKTRSGGGFDENGQFSWAPTGNDVLYVEPVRHRLFRESDAYSSVITDAAGFWTGDFKNEELNEPKNKSYFPPFDGDDRMVHHELVDPLRSLSALVTNAILDDRLGILPRVTEAFDQNGEHQIKPPSLHYEGRSIDFGADSSDGRARLTGLAMLAGFRRFDNELTKQGVTLHHVHVAHSGSVPNVSVESLIDNVEYGANVGAISPSAYLALRPLLDDAHHLVAGRFLSELPKEELEELSKMLKEFEQTAKKLSQSKEVFQGFGLGPLKAQRQGEGMIGGLQFNAEQLRSLVDALAKSAGSLNDLSTSRAFAQSEERGSPIRGADAISGDSADDYLVAGSKSYDANRVALAAILAEWIRIDLDYNLRIDHLRGVSAGGLNGAVRLTASTVKGDGVADAVAGGPALDWFWASLGEANDLEALERRN